MITSTKSSVKRILLSALSVVILLNVTVYSQSNLKNKISQGFSALYNFNFQSADKTFNEIIKNYPNNPAGYHYKSIHYLWYYLDNTNPYYLENFLALSDTAIEKAEILLEKDSTDLFNFYILGSVYANKTFAFTREENYVDAIFAAQKFYGYFNQILSRDSLYYDAYMGIGLYNFAISRAPQTWSWALSLSGVTGDKHVGLDYLETSVKKGKYSSIDSRFYLSQIYSEFLLKYPQAEGILLDLVTWYPKNLLFRFSLANLYLKKYDLKNATKYYKSVIDSRDTVFTQLKNYAGLFLGDILYSQGKYDESRSYLINFLEFSNEDRFKGITALKLGLSHLLEGDSLSALLYFEKTSEGNDDLDDDVFAEKKGEQYLKILPGTYELRLILIKNLIDSGKFGQALDSLENFVNLQISDSLRAEALLYMSEVNYNLGKHKKSLEYAVAVIHFDNCELWVKPFACYYAARVSKDLHSSVDAELFIEYAGNYKNYFYENKLKDKLNFLSFILKEKN
ncbi:MAG: tetratricopeptide repeat protein [Ignavibacteriales bacterium]